MEEFRIDLPGNLQTAGGRAIDKRIFVKWFFSQVIKHDPVVFDVASITLR